MTKNKSFTTISISMDGVWAGSGYLHNGTIEDCGAQFCDDNDESLELYEMIEEAIAAGRDHVDVEISDDDATHRITWSIVEPIEPDYVVMHSPEGSDEEYIGSAKTLEAAREMAAEFDRGERGSLEKSLWDTARTAGHCGGISAPPEMSDDEPIEWLGKDGSINICRAAE